MAQKALMAGVVAAPFAVGGGLVALRGDSNSHRDGSQGRSDDTVALPALPATATAAPASTAGFPATARLTASALRGGADLPIAIFHAFDERFSVLQGYVWTLANQGYSHVQIPPVQKSHATRDWKVGIKPSISLWWRGAAVRPSSRR